MTDVLLHHARTMRRHATPPERVLWSALRAFQLEGAKFRRQVPMGPFIVDFYCASARLVIEVDGATHAEPCRDAERDAWLRARGLVVLRFWNNEVMGNLAGVLEVVRASLASRGRETG